MMKLEEVKVLIIGNINKKNTKVKLIEGLEQAECFLRHTEIEE